MEGWLNLLNYTLYKSSENNVIAKVMVFKQWQAAPYAYVLDFLIIINNYIFIKRGGRRKNNIFKIKYLNRKFVFVNLFCHRYYFCSY